MSKFSAKFKQSPVEVKRYVLDFSLQLATGESVLSTVITVIQTGGTVLGSPVLVVNGVALLPPVSGVVLGAAYFVSGGIDTGIYEVKFLTTTSVGQVLEDVVQYTLAEKL